ncbi:MAG: rhodanese-like domain-containing protein [Bdellovibrionales bacterium]|nr:rhodanese-like domain-containing protein [Bdellovibrionales bacterium]
MSHFTKLSSAEPNPDLDRVEDVSPDEVNAKKDQLCLVDVRSPDEYVGPLGHIEGSILIELNELPHSLEKLPRQRTIVFICRSGRRSANATAIAKDKGFESAFNMKGGMLLWNEMGLEIKTKGA